MRGLILAVALAAMASVAHAQTISSVDAFPKLAPLGSNSAPTYSFTGFPTYGMYFGANGTTITHATTPTLNIRSNGVVMGSGASLRWTNAASADGNTTDVYLYRGAAGTIDMRDGTSSQMLRVYNTYGDALNYERGLIGWSGNVFNIGVDWSGTGVPRSVQFLGSTYRFTTTATVGWSNRTQVQAPNNGTWRFTKEGATQPPVSELPTCTSLITGTRAFVTDATDTTHASAVAGGGTNHVPVYCDGGTTTWRIG